MRIRGKKPWALINGKIVRFKTPQDFDRWEEEHIRQRLDEVDKLGPAEFLSIEEAFDSLEQHAKQREVYFQVTRRPPKRKVRRRRLWPA
jgi:hypothetical protein